MLFCTSAGRESLPLLVREQFLKLGGILVIFSAIFFKTDWGWDLVGNLFVGNHILLNLSNTCAATFFEQRVMISSVITSKFQGGLEADCVEFFVSDVSETCTY